MAVVLHGHAINIYRCGIVVSVAAQVGSLLLYELARVDLLALRHSPTIYDGDVLDVELAHGALPLRLLDLVVHEAGVAFEVVAGEQPIYDFPLGAALPPKLSQLLLLNPLLFITLLGFGQRPRLETYYATHLFFSEKSFEIWGGGGRVQIT